MARTLAPPLLLCAFLFLYFASSALSQQVDPSKSLVWGPGLTSGQAGLFSVFYLRPVDTNGKNISNCNLRVGALYNYTGSQQQHIISRPDCNSQGFFTFQYQPFVAATYNLYVIITDQLAGQSPYHPSIAAGPVYPPGSVGNGTGLNPNANLVVGTTIRFSIYDYDAYGNRNTSCLLDDVWQVILTGAATVIGQPGACQNGVWPVSYTAIVSGNYDVAVALGPLNLNDSPFPVSLAPGPIDPKTLNATGPGASKAVAGNITLINIYARDSFSNFITTCSGNTSLFWVYLVYGQFTVNATYLSCTAGQYQFSYNVTRAAVWTLFIEYDGIQSHFTPFIQVSASSSLSAGYTIATGVGLTNGTAGIPAPFNIQPYDIYNNPINFCLASINLTQWVVKVTAQNNPSIMCPGSVSGCNSQNGQLNGQYSCKVATTYMLTISYGGISIKGSPFHPFVTPGSIAGPESTATGSGLYVAYAGQPAEFIINTFDQYNNDIVTCQSPITRNWDIVVYASDLGVSVNGDVTACSLGNYTVRYVLTEISNLYTIQILYSNTRVAQSPYSLVTYPGPPELNNCNFQGAGLYGAVAGVAAQYFATCQDVYYNPITLCIYDGVYWNNTLSGPAYYQAPFVRCDNSSGTANFTFQYTAYKSGTYDLHIVFSLTPDTLDYSPVVVPNNFSPLNSIAVGPGVSWHNITAGVNTTFTVISTDQYGNPVTQCISLSDLQITIVSADGQTTVYPAVSQCNGGQIPVSYMSTVAGNYWVYVKYKGNNIKGSPYNVTIIAGKINAGSCQATGDGLTRAVAGVPAPVRLFCYDQYYNPVNYCVNNSSWSLYLTGPDQLTGTVPQCGGGYYSGWWLGTIAGNYSFSINFNGSPIKNSPFSPVLVAGQLNDSMSVAKGPGFDGSQITAGATTYINVTGYDTYSNPITGCGYINWWTSKATTGSHQVTGTSSVCSNGVYTIYYQPTYAGSYTVIVRGQNSNVQNNPGSVYVVAGPFFVQSSTFQIQDVAVAGQIIPLQVQGFDRYHNPITQCLLPLQNFSVVAQRNDAPRWLFFGTIWVCNNGVWNGTLQVNYTGQYSVAVQYTYQPLSNSPQPLQVVSGNVSLGYSLARGEGVDPTAHIIAGAGTWFYIDLYNQYGVKLNDSSYCSPSNWSVTFSPEISAYPSARNASFGTCQNATFPVYYNATWARYYTINIYSFGQRIGGNPYHSRVYPTYLDPSKTVIYGFNNTFDNYVNFTIIARDIFNNSVANTSSDLFLTYIEPACLGVQPFCYPNGDALACSFGVEEGGRYCVSVYYRNLSYVVLPTTPVLVYGGLACTQGCVNGYCFASSPNSTSYVCNCFQGYSGSDCSQSDALAVPDSRVRIVQKQLPVAKLSVAEAQLQGPRVNWVAQLRAIPAVVALLTLIVSPVIGFVGYYVFDKLTHVHKSPVSA